MVEAKKKKSSAERLFSRYKTYEGEPGSPEQWANLARTVLSFKSDNALSLLGIDQIPSDLEALKQARRKAMMTAHPDRGGDTETAAKINEAFLSLERMLQAAKPRAAASAPVGLVDPPRCTGSLPSDLEDEDWVFEVKEDGERFVLYLGFDPYSRNTLANTLLSRHKSTSDGCYVDRSSNAPHISGAKYEGLHGTVLDGEVFLRDLPTTVSIMSSIDAEAEEKQRLLGRVDYIAFDISFHRGEDVRSKPYSQRRALLRAVVAEMKNPHVRVVQQFSRNIQATFDYITSKGGEGLVGKTLSGKYGQSWAKLKKSYSVSCIITGYRAGQKSLEGMVGSLALSVYKDGKLVEVGFASGMTNAQRQDMTDHFDRYLGQVVDVFCMELTQDKRLRSPTFHRVRTDVNADECTYEKLLDDLSKVRTNRNK